VLVLRLLVALLFLHRLLLLLSTGARVDVLLLWRARESAMREEDNDEDDNDDEDDDDEDGGLRRKPLNTRLRALPPLLLLLRPLPLPPLPPPPLPPFLVR